MQPIGSTNTVRILTPVGAAAIAVVRFSGSGVDSFIRQHLSKIPRLHACVHTTLTDHDQTIDDPVAVQVDDQTLDLSLHGGAWVVQRVVAIANRAGFVTINEEPADTLETEMSRDLPLATTRQALRILLAQPFAWRAMIETKDTVAKERARCDRSLIHLLHPPTVVIVGAPNVGKSTLANQLFGMDRSITADLPGTTRDWVGERANIDGLMVTLVDTPGWRDSDDAIEQAAIKRSRRVVARAQLVVRVLDATRPSEMTQAQELADTIVVVNKIDRVASSTAMPESAIPLCARSGVGVEQLRHAILAFFGCVDLTSLHARCWTARQQKLLTA